MKFVHEIRHKLQLGVRSRFLYGNLMAKLGRRARHIFYINEFFLERPINQRLLNNVSKALLEKDIRMIPCTPNGLKAFVQSREDLYLAHNPVRPMFPGTRYWGNFLPPRSEGMRLLEKEQVPVMTWAIPRNETELLSLFEKWNAPELLLKRAKSYRGMGVQVLRPEDVGGLQWKDTDVFCKIIEAPRVYKVHFFGSVILGGFYLEAPPVRELKRMQAYFEPRTRDAVPNAEYHDKFVLTAFTPPEDLAGKLGRLGRRLLDLGAAYSSVDLMDDNGRMVAIELNTNTIGTYRCWNLWPKRYEDKMVEAIEKFNALF